MSTPWTTPTSLHPKVPTWEIVPCPQSPAWKPCPMLSSPYSFHDVPVLCEGGTHSVHESRWGGESVGTQMSFSCLVPRIEILHLAPSPWKVKCSSYPHMVDEKLRLRGQVTCPHRQSSGLSTAGFQSTCPFYHPDCLHPFLQCLLSPWNLSKAGGWPGQAFWGPFPFLL